VWKKDIDKKQKIHKNKREKKIIKTIIDEVYI